MAWIEISIDLKDIGMENLITKKKSDRRFYTIKILQVISEFGPKGQRSHSQLRKTLKITCFIIVWTSMIALHFFLHQNLVSHVRYMHLQICLSNAVLVGIRIHKQYIMVDVFKKFCEPHFDLPLTMQMYGVVWLIKNLNHG